MTLNKLFCCVLVCLATMPVGTHAQSILGRVLRQDTGAGLRGATLELVDSLGIVRGETSSDTAGSFRLRAPAPGTYRVRAAHIGYAAVESQPLTVPLAVELQIEITLAEAAVALDPVRVIAERSMRTGRLAEFYSRADRYRGAGAGTIYMRSDLADMPGAQLSHILARVPLRRQCPMTYFLDGMPIDYRSISTLDPEIVEGVEIYTSRLSLPPEYSNRVTCGATLVWLRQDLATQPFSWGRLLKGAGILGVMVLILRLATSL